VVVVRTERLRGETDAIEPDLDAPFILLKAS
jgi:hypothetical protein